MKTLLIFLLSFSVQASNWMPVSKIQSNSNQAYQLESECVKQSQEQCLDVGDEPKKVSLGYASLNDVMGDDLARPIWEAASESELCEDEADCRAKLLLKVCPPLYEKFINAGFTELYCTKVIGYEQKVVGKSLSLDEASWTAYQNAQNAAAQQAQALGQAKQARVCGSSVMDVVLVRNAPKNLTKGQVKQLVNTMNPIKSLLETGSLVTAKEEVQAIVADGTIITEGDKLAVVAAINSCLGL